MADEGGNEERTLLIHCGFLLVFFMRRVECMQPVSGSTRRSSVSAVNTCRLSGLGYLQAHPTIQSLSSASRDFTSRQHLNE